MSNLGLSGAQSLQALNQWISVIDTNLTNTKRAGYKETRLSLRSGEIDIVGKTATHFGDAIALPSAVLMVDKTLILDHVQGNLTPTENLSDFAIEGKGYFVVEDDVGKKYATRDGEFHFSNDGILVNAQGLKVLTYGQDYVRVPATEHFSVDSHGTSLSSSTFGDRQLMMIDLPNAGKLFYSKYGYTTFELGDYVPVTIDNNFDKTVDGLSPYLAESRPTLTVNAPAGATSITLNSVAGISGTIIVNGQSLAVLTVNQTTKVVTFNPPTGLTSAANIDDVVTTNFSSYQSSYTHNKSTGTTLSAPALAGATSATLASVAGINIGGTITINGQELVVTGILGPLVSFKTPLSPNTGLTAAAAVGSGVSISGSITVDLGEHSQALVTAHTFTDFSNSFKFTSSAAVLNTFGFNFGQKNASDALSDSGFFAGIQGGQLVIGDKAGVSAVAAIPAFVTVPPTEYEMSLEVSGGTFKLSLRNTSTGAITSGIRTGFNSYDGGYQSIGTHDMAGGPVPGTSVTITSLHVNERDKEAYYDTVILGGNADLLGSMVRQQFIEESTSTIADAMPMLSNTQKMFSAISKIISVANAVTDDANGLIR